MESVRSEAERTPIANRHSRQRPARVRVGSDSVHGSHSLSKPGRPCRKGRFSRIETVSIGYCCCHSSDQSASSPRATLRAAVPSQRLADLPAVSMIHDAQGPAARFLQVHDVHCGLAGQSCFPTSCERLPAVLSSKCSRRVELALSRGQRRHSIRDNWSIGNRLAPQATHGNVAVAPLANGGRHLTSVPIRGPFRQSNDHMAGFRLVLMFAYRIERVCAPEKNTRRRPAECGRFASIAATGSIRPAASTVGGRPRTRRGSTGANRWRGSTARRPPRSKGTGQARDDPHPRHGDHCGHQTQEHGHAEISSQTQAGPICSGGN